MQIPAVDELGANIEREWRDKDYQIEAFPGLAAAALARAELSDRFGPDEVVDQIFSGDALPQQEDPTATFGQPPVTIFRAGRFYIDALFWVDGTTSIHQHGFSGAFSVLHGSSIETTFRFEQDRDVDGLFKLGNLKVLTSGLLRQGDVRPIVSGSRLIHSIFHLERPSVSIVVRTYRDPNAGPQFEYARSGIGHDPFFKDPARDRAMQFVKMLRTVEHPHFEKVVGDLVGRSDLHTAYRILRDCANFPDRDLIDRLSQRIRDSAVGKRIQQSLEQTRRLAFLQSRRALVKDPELRFFLGVLLNAQSRRDALELVRARVVDDRPERVVSGWLRRLSEVTAKLQAGGMAWEPNLIGLPAFTDQLEVVLESVLAGRAIDEVDPERSLMDRLRALPALTCLWA